VVLVGLSYATSGSAGDDPKSGKTVSELVVIANRPPTVEELDVIAQAKCLPSKREPGSDRPEVVSTYPRQDETVRQGLLILRVTFDQPMTCSGFFLFQRKDDPCSDVNRTFAQAKQQFLMSFEHKTIRVACFVRPGERYTFWMNPTLPSKSDDPPGIPGPPFMSLRGRLLASHDVTFTTSSGAPVQTISDALSADPETVLADVYRPARRAQAADSRQ
jgi:hypothetical protein